MTAARPVVGVLCCNEMLHRPVQTVATRFVAPLAKIAEATVFLIPAVSDANDVAAVASHLDGLLLTGSRSHVSPARYGGCSALDGDRIDEDRDETALRLAEAMIERGRPVFGVCRGFQELNVLFGGSLSTEVCGGMHHVGHAVPYDAQFAHRHLVELSEHGMLARETGARRVSVNSIHEQGIDRLGGGLTVEAIATDDGLVEAISARPCGGDVLAVQWHPEWDAAADRPSQAFFGLMHRSLRAAGRA